MEEEWDQNEGEGEEWEDEVKQEQIEDAHWNKEDFAEESVGTTYSGTYTGVEPDRKEWERPPVGSVTGEAPGEAVEAPPKVVIEDLEYSGRVSRRPVQGKFEREDYQMGLRKPNLGEIMSTNVGFGQSLKRMVREAWGAAKPDGRATLRSPCNKVRFTQTGSLHCTTTAECMQECRNLQKYYMDLGFPDIPYNFLIGGDGVVYHARGWMKQADRSPAFHRLKKNCVDVAYMGQFVDKKIPYEMLSAAADFLKYGLKVSRLTPFFQSFTYLSDFKRS
ncbi:peptidoglycan recognition protein 3-like [Macrosteles quadrilineatus]|uniref:peptidoglycan recognition protein 3-like n=1 Tax=Macrosteles quadrilineatus TaxID=74068 RepID=UPI0023E25985|nr:peptidoglycan recognition protein 3-like [Macrosteles quadrilineatus]